MSLQTYLNQLREFNPLSREELLPLIKKAQKGNQQARNKIVRHNLRLVVYIAKRYGNSKIDIEDLIAEGSFGLFGAIKKFKPNKKATFATYAVWWIRQKIARYIDDTITVIRVPVWLSDIYRERLRRQRKLKKPKKYNKKTEQKLLWGDMKISSLHKVVGEDSELLHFLGVTYPITKEIDFRLIYEALIKILTPREKGILKDRLAGLTLKEVGKKYSLSRERIRQIEVEIVQLLKTKINLYKDYK